MLARILLIGVLIVSTAAVAADHLAIVKAGGNVLPIRTGEGGAIAALIAEADANPTEIAPPGAALSGAAAGAANPPAAAPVRPRFCGFAPCGMPLRCDTAPAAP